ncbi:hypothetical protein BH11BAC5_BH11BAC5_14530 [soil metagenome]
MASKMTKKFLTFFFIALVMPVGLLAQQDAAFILKSKALALELNRQGKVTGITYNRTGTHKPVIAYTSIESFASTNDIAILAKDKKSIRFEHILHSDSLQQSCTLVEIFSSTVNSIRWEMEITGAGASWSSPIKTVVEYPAGKASRFWTSWGAPQFDSADCDAQLLAALSPYKNATGQKGWLDPLVPLPFSKQTFYYGAPPFEYTDPKVGFIPFQGNLFAIPFASVFEKQPGIGLSVFLSPEDDIVNLLMNTRADGSIVFERLFNRVNSEKKLHFALDLVVHESDWRSALSWFAVRYPGYINPKNQAAAMLGGTAAYSNFFDDFDAAKMKRMAFTVNWQASFDFPYMGMFLPPVKRDVRWTRLGGGTISIQQMDDYAKRMKQKGFYVLSYFNVTEFGSWFKYTQPLPGTDSNASWKDCSHFLYKKFPAALLAVADKVKITDALDFKTIHGGPYYSWKDAVAMDCGDPAYQQFLLNQAQRHIREIPNSFGICIDRLDWLRFFNENADDGITLFDGKPARSLVNSWKGLMGKLGPLMHNAGKSILVNNHYKRIDLLQQADGILDEFTNATAPLNLTAFLTLNKPALGWTPGKEVIEAAGGDNFFQKYLYLGVFPMCPFPGNDHALQPDSMVDQLYLDYGPLMNQLKEKQWVLQPGIVAVKNDKAKVNIFKTNEGYTIPVVYGDGNVVTVVLKNSIFAKGNFNYKVFLPGRRDAVHVKARRIGDAVEINVPLVRGAAMVTVTGK